MMLALVRAITRRSAWSSDIDMAPSSTQLKVVSRSSARSISRSSNSFSFLSAAFLPPVRLLSAVLIESRSAVTPSLYKPVDGGQKLDAQRRFESVNQLRGCFERREPPRVCRRLQLLRSGAMTSKTTNKFSPEVRARAVRMVLDHEHDHRLALGDGDCRLRARSAARRRRCMSG